MHNLSTRASLATLGAIGAGFLAFFMTSAGPVASNAAVVHSSSVAAVGCSGSTGTPSGSGAVPTVKAAGAPAAPGNVGSKTGPSGFTIASDAHQATDKRPDPSVNR